MALACWLGIHDWDVIRKSIPIHDEKIDSYLDKFACADLWNDFRSTIELLDGSREIIRVRYTDQDKKESYHPVLIVSKGRKELSSAPVITDAICRKCSKTKLTLTNIVKKKLQHHVMYESPCARDARKKKLEAEVNKCLSDIKRHPAEIY